MASEFALVQWCASELAPEELQADFGADARAVFDAGGGLGRLPVGLVQRFEPPGDLDAVGADVVGVDLERLAEPDGVQHVLLGGVGVAGQCGRPLHGERVVAGAEQGLHLLGRDDVACVQPDDAGHAGADPASGNLALLGVVAGQADVAAFGGVQGRYLTGQVVVPGPGGDAVEGHRHTLPKPIEEAIGTRQLRGIFGNAEGVCHMRKVVP